MYRTEPKSTSLIAVFLFVVILSGFTLILAQDTERTAPRQDISSASQQPTAALLEDRGTGAEQTHNQLPSVVQAARQPDLPGGASGRQTWENTEWLKDQATVEKICRPLRGGDVSSIAIVGNGPVTERQRLQLKSASRVVRFNKMNNRRPSDRVDVWVVRHGEAAERRYWGFSNIRPHLLRRVIPALKGIWFLGGEPHDIEALRAAFPLLGSAEAVLLNLDDFEAAYQQELAANGQAAVPMQPLRRGATHASDREGRPPASLPLPPLRRRMLGGLPAEGAAGGTLEQLRWGLMRMDSAPGNGSAQPLPHPPHGQLGPHRAAPWPGQQGRPPNGQGEGDEPGASPSTGFVGIRLVLQCVAGTDIDVRIYGMNWSPHAVWSRHKVLGEKEFVMAQQAAGRLTVVPAACSAWRSCAPRPICRHGRQDNLLPDCRRVVYRP